MSGVIPPPERNRMRGEVNRYFPHTASIERSNPVDENDDDITDEDPYGNEIVTTPQPHIEEIRCRLWNTLGRNTTDGGAATPSTELMASSWRMNVAHGTDIRRGDRVTDPMDGDEAIPGGPFIVEIVSPHLSHWTCVLTEYGGI